MSATEFRQKVKALVDENWTSTKAPLLLSKLGMILGQEFDVQVETAGLKLATFLRAAMPTEIKVVQDANNRVIVGAVPATVSELGENPFGESHAGDNIVRRRSSYTRYQRGLWDAFTTQIPGGKRRYISIGDQILVVDSDETEAPPPGIEIKPDDIIELSELMPGERFAAAADKIEDWARRNSVDISKFRRVGREEERSVLSILLESVNHDDLGKISLPLNVVKILLGTKAK